MEFMGYTFVSQYNNLSFKHRRDIMIAYYDTTSYDQIVINSCSIVVAQRWKILILFNDYLKRFKARPLRSNLR